ncbi:MAG: cytochrome C, partial [Desulfuromonadales bacterium]|nr:cytochrome C [Desulfuromonadales bacterium]NIS40670.1 cytochrome C [Desulfuromonadales bacterium]
HVTFGPDQNEMWCSTCHDPHGGVPGTPLLQTTNSGSTLCLMCHLK